MSGRAAKLRDTLNDAREQISELWCDAHGLIGSTVIEPEHALTIVRVIRARLDKINTAVIDAIDVSQCEYEADATTPESEAPAGSREDG